MKKYKDLSTHEKIQVKQHAMNVYGKRWHAPTPNFCGRLNELQIQTILN